MICKTCICHKEMKPEKVYGDYVWCKKWEASVSSKLDCCPYVRSVCGDCTKCDEERVER